MCRCLYKDLNPIGATISSHKDQHEMQDTASGINKTGTFSDLQINGLTMNISVIFNCSPSVNSLKETISSKTSLNNQYVIYIKTNVFIFVVIILVFQPLCSLA